MDQFDREFASHWDKLVGRKKRSAADKAFLLNLVRRYVCKRILDVALGTAFHTIELMNKGLHVKALDILQTMIEVAMTNAARESIELDAVCSDWVDMKRTIQERFYCIICVGNSLACEMDTDKRQIAVQKWSDALTENGVVIVDRRNHESLPAGEYRSRANGQYFGETIRIGFNKIVKDETEFSYTFSDGRTFSLKMFPILDQEMRSICRNAGLGAA